MIPDPCESLANTQLRYDELLGQVRTRPKPRPNLITFPLLRHPDRASIGDWVSSGLAGVGVGRFNLGRRQLLVRLMNEAIDTTLG
jgi:hypothetical protein